MNELIYKILKRLDGEISEVRELIRDYDGMVYLDKTNTKAITTRDELLNTLIRLNSIKLYIQRTIDADMNDYYKEVKRTGEIEEGLQGGEL